MSTRGLSHQQGTASNQAQFVGRARRRAKTVRVSQHEMATLIDPRLSDVVKAYPDMWFVADEGSKWCCVLHQPAIHLKLLALESHVRNSVFDASVFAFGLGHTEVVIVDASADEPPLRFASMEVGLRYWGDLHKAFGSPEMQGPLVPDVAN
jgi:hypothetical protein